MPDRHANDTADRLFIGWFGPRGLATIVFAVLVLDEKLPGNDTIMLAAGWTVLLSVIAHGVTANPLVKAIGARPAALGEEAARRWENVRAGSSRLLMPYVVDHAGGTLIPPFDHALRVDLGVDPHRELVT